MRLISLLLLALVLSSPAMAQEHRGWSHGGGDMHHHDWHGGWHNPSQDVTSAVLGGIIGGAISNWFSPAPVVIVQPPPPPVVIVQPAPSRPEPWSAEWMDYCNSTYRSFDAHTGYFMGFDGVPHFCR